jgi:hypothetical protein
LHLEYGGIKNNLSNHSIGLVGTEIFFNFIAHYSRFDRTCGYWDFYFIPHTLWLLRFLLFKVRGELWLLRFFKLYSPIFEVRSDLLLPRFLFYCPIFEVQSYLWLLGFLFYFPIFEVRSDLWLLWIIGSSQHIRQNLSTCRILILSSPLKPLSQMNWNLVGSIYGRYIKIAHFVPIR